MSQLCEQGRHVATPQESQSSVPGYAWCVVCKENTDFTSGECFYCGCPYKSTKLAAPEPPSAEDVDLFRATHGSTGLAFSAGWDGHENSATGGSYRDIAYRVGAYLRAVCKPKGGEG